MRNNTKKLTTSAIMLALATVLYMLKIYRLPNDGCITAGSMVPIIIISYLYGPKWGLFIGFVYSLLIMLFEGIAPPPVQNISSFFAVIMLDYVLAFSVLGTASFFTKKICSPKLKLVSGTIIVVCIRFICHLISGVLIWKAYAPEGQSPLVYSFVYNGSFMGIELIITVLIIFLLSNTLQRYIAAYN